MAASKPPRRPNTSSSSAWEESAVSRWPGLAETHGADFEVLAVLVSGTESELSRSVSVGVEGGSGGSEGRSWIETRIKDSRVIVDVAVTAGTGHRD
jgi:hypothetical protein